MVNKSVVYNILVLPLQIPNVIIQFSAPPSHCHQHRKKYRIELTKDSKNIEVIFPEISPAVRAGIADSRWLTSWYFLAQEAAQVESNESRRKPKFISFLSYVLSFNRYSN